MKILKQLQDKEFRFIRLLPLSKEPMDLWGSKQYSFDDKIIQDHNGNIGITGKGGDLVFIDFDDFEEQDMLKIRAFFGPTLTIKTSSGHGYHVYLKVPNYVGGRKFNVKEGGIEIRTGNMYVVAPGSEVTLKDGNKGTYEVVTDTEIAEVSLEDFKKFLQIFPKGTEIKREGFEKWQIERVFRKMNISNDLIVKINSEENCGYESRSNKDSAIVTELLSLGLESMIKDIFKNCPCGSKFNEKGKNGDAYLDITVKKAREYIGNDKVEKIKHYNEIKVKIYATSRNDLKAEYNEFLELISEMALGQYSTPIQDELINLLSEESGLSRRKLQAEFYASRKISLNRKKDSIFDIYNADMPSFTYWFYPLIPKRDIILIGGKAGNFKSLFAMLLSCCMVSGKSFDDNFRIEAKPKILYYDLEMSNNQIHWRTQYIYRGLEYSPLETDYFHVLHDFNKVNINQELEEAKNYDIIVLDSYRRFLTGNESDSEITNKLFIDFLKPLKDMGKTIIIIHHMKKNNPDMTDEDFQDMFRGSTDIPAQMDLAYAIFKKKETTKSDKTIEFNVKVAKAKNRNGYPIQDFILNVVKDDNEKTTTVKIVHMGDSKEKLADTIKEYIKSIVPSGKTVKTSSITTEVCERFDVSSRYVFDLISEMESDGDIYSPKKGLYTSDRPELSDQERRLDDFGPERSRDRGNEL